MSKIPVNDAALISAYIQGDSKSFETLLNRSKSKVYTTIYLIVKDRYIAEDLLQETYIKALDVINQGKYNEEGKFLPWALRIAHNLCVDHFRKVKRTPIVHSNDEHDIFENLNLSEEGAEGVIMRSQSHERVRQMLDMLPQDQREVIVLRHFANLSFKEIADKTNCSINTALGRMRYGLINLRKLMVEYQVAL